MPFSALPLLLSWFIRLAPYLGVLGLLVTIYFKGVIAERQAQELRQARSTIVILETQKQIAERATEAAQQAASARQTRAAELEEKVRDYELELAAAAATAQAKGGAGTRCLLDGADVKRLHGLQ